MNTICLQIYATKCNKFMSYMKKIDFSNYYTKKSSAYHTPHLFYSLHTICIQSVNMLYPTYTYNFII